VTQLGWIGVWLLVAAGLAILVELALMAVWGWAIGKRAQTLSEGLQTERGLIESDLQRLRLAIEETRRLWQPYGKALRWLRHPLVIALLQSYRRRATAR
jgi:hypothetical protein